jgi:PAS domain S-box-containing protein
MPQDHKVYLPPGGTMGELIRSKDWSKTPLGPMDQWPQTLLTNLATILESPFPHLIYWGRQLTILYNDAYIPLLGGKQEALGNCFFDVWPELRDSLEPLIEKAFAGESVYIDSSPFELIRHGYPEQTWFNFSLSPLRDAQGNVVGLFAIVIEMTKREREEQEREERFRATFEQAAVGMAHVDLSGRFLRVNEKYCRIAGYSQEEMLRLSFQDITHPKDLDRDVDQARQLLSGEIQTYSMEKRYVRKDGAIVWINLTGSLVRNHAGDPDYFIAVVEDISERKLAEEELQKVHRLIQGITQGTEDLIAAEDKEFRYIYFNDAYRREFKKLWGQEITIGTSMVEAMAPWPDEQKKARDLWQRALNGESFKISLEFGPLERERQTYELQFNPVIDQKGRQIGAAHILRNVTEQVRLRKELHHRAAELDAALESLAEGVVFYDTNHQIVRMNTMAKHILGFSEKEVQLPAKERIKLFQIRTKEGMPPTREDLVGWRALQGEVVIYDEMLLKPKGKEEFISILTSAAPIKAPDGQIVGVIQTLNDITELKKSEHALRESEEKFSRAFFGNPGFMFITEAENGRFIEVNEAYCELTGYSREEMLGRTSTELGILSPDAREQTKNTSFSQGKIRNLETRITTKSGKTRHVVFSLDIVNLGGTTSFICSGFDITQRKQAEEALRENEARYSSLFHNMTEEVHFWEILRDEKREITTWRLVDANPPTLKTWGKTLQEIKGKTTDEIFGPGATEHYLPVVRKIFAENAPYSFEDYFPHLDKHFRFTSIPMGDHFITTGADITAIKKVHEHLERQVRERTSELELANRAKDEFLANMSHEIRTPMTGVLGLTEILLHQELPATVQSDLEMIRSSADSVMILINDLFDLSRISQGKFEFHPEEFDLRSMVWNALGPFEFQARSMDLEFSLSFDETVPSQILCDKHRLGQVLKNLVSNAIKFTERGFVRVHVRAEKNDEDTHRLHFTITDSGLGIPKSKQKEVFGAFTQIDPSYSKKFAGMGLGLTISKSLVKGMGGEISVESTKRKGATFRFYLTCGIVTEDRELTTPSITLRDLPPMTILIAEDNAVNRLFLRRALVTAGHKVGEAENGRHALKKVKDTPFDLVLMDIQMPEMDGVEATRRIRSGKHGRSDIPIIALTAYAMKGDREKFLENGMDGYVTKPVDFSELARMIAEVCGIVGRPSG